VVSLLGDAGGWFKINLGGVDILNFWRRLRFWYVNVAREGCKSVVPFVIFMAISILGGVAICAIGIVSWNFISPWDKLRELVDLSSHGTRCLEVAACEPVDNTRDREG